MPPVNRSGRPARPSYGRSTGGPGMPASQKVRLMDPAHIDPLGLDDNRALLPKTPRTDVPAGTEARIRFPAPGLPWSGNQESSMHRHERARLRREWRETTLLACLDQRATLAPIAGCRVEITVALPFPKANANRDPHNYGGGAGTVKAIVDGITDSGLVFPDDRALWVRCTEPVLWVHTDVVVRLLVIGPGELFDPAG